MSGIFTRYIALQICYIPRTIIALLIAPLKHIIIPGNITPIGLQKLKYVI
jgi:hypothetical protein